MRTTIETATKEVIREKFESKPMKVEQTLIKEENNGVVKVEEILVNTVTEERTVVRTIVNEKDGSYIVTDVKPYVRPRPFPRPEPRPLISVIERPDEVDQEVEVITCTEGGEQKISINKVPEE